MSKKTVSSRIRKSILKKSDKLELDTPKQVLIPKRSTPMNSSFKKVPLKVLKKRGKKIYARWYNKMTGPSSKKDESDSYNTILLDGRSFPVGRFPLEGDWLANLKEKLDEQGIRNGVFGIIRSVSFGLNPRSEVSLRLEVMTGENQFELFEFDRFQAENFIKTNKISDLEGIKKQPCMVCKLIDSKMVRMLSL
jgi:hypothetical protein